MSKKSKDKAVKNQPIETPILEKSPKTSLGKPLLNIIILEIILYFLYAFLKGIHFTFFSYLILILLFIGAIAAVALCIYSLYKKFSKSNTPTT